MKTMIKIVGVAAAALTVTAVGGGITQAQAAHPAAATSTSVAAEVTGPDTDTLQQGDQTTPDTNSGCCRRAGSSRCRPRRRSIQGRHPPGGRR